MTTNKIAITLVPSYSHSMPGHPESPDRFQHFDKLSQVPFSDLLEHVNALVAPLSAVTAVHPPAYLDEIEQACIRGPGFVDYGDTYVTSGSFKAALEAVGGTLEIINAVVEGIARNGFAIIRPPGHHASATRAGGFCLFNNIAIAARYVQSLGLPRVMIVDFDVHHGNGTQDIFENDPNVLYLSTHQSGIYPGTGRENEIGCDEGEGTVINIPLPARAGDGAFSAISEQVITPIAKRFSPDILLISAGFDAHWNDPLASLQLSTSGYGKIGQALVSLAESICEGRIIFLLEGGYEPNDLSDNVLAIMYALANETPPNDRLGPAPFPEANIDNLLNNVLSIHAVNPKNS